MAEGVHGPLLASDPEVDVKDDERPHGDGEAGGQDAGQRVEFLKEVMGARHDQSEDDPYNRAD